MHKLNLDGSSPLWLLLLAKGSHTTNKHGCGLLSMAINYINTTYSFLFEDILKCLLLRDRKNGSHKRCALGKGKQLR